MDPYQNSHYHFGGNSSTSLLPVSAFSAYSLLRNCNYLLPSQLTELNAKTVPSSVSRISLDGPLQSPINEEICNNSNKYLTQKSFLTSGPLFSYSPHLHVLQTEPSSPGSDTLSSFYHSSFKRQRGEKKAIPEEQKDEKYFERRRRNNQAAKKSRDARKIREDQVALKATILEHENAILRAQVLTLREETSSLRQMLLQKKTLELVSNDSHN